MKKKVIYQTGHYGFLIHCMLHKMKYHPNNDAIFLVDKVLMNELTIDFVKKNKNNFKNVGKVILYNDKDIIRNGSTSVETKEQYTLQYFDNLLAKNQIDLAECEEIYSMFDTYNAFGVYLSMKKIFFSMIEIAANFCQSTKRYCLNKAFPVYDEMIYKYKAISYECAYLKKLFCSGSKIVELVSYEENVNAISMLKSLNKQEIKTIIDCYNLPPIVEGEKVLFSFNSAWIAGQFGFDIPHYMYLNQQVADYFLPEDCKLLLKPHPNTDFDKKYWLQFFPKADYIPGYFPAMLLPYIENLNIYKSLNTGTTGVDQNDQKSINVPMKFFYTHGENNLIHVALKLMEFIKTKKSNLEHYGLHNSVVWSMMSVNPVFDKFTSWSSLELEDDNVLIVGNINWNPGEYKEKLIKRMDSVNNNAVVIFLNNKNDFTFMTNDQRFLPYIIPIHIRKKKLKEDTMENMKEEILYVYCKDEKMLNKIKKFNYSKKLKYVGVELNAEYDEKNQYLDLVNLKLDYLISKQ